MSARHEGAPDPPMPAGTADGPLVIGLTGPIGCGKSTVASMLSELGGTWIDADALAHQVTEPGKPASGAIRDRFGPDVFEPSGVLDRAALAAIVFADSAALRDLEAIVHPGVRTLIDDRLSRARRDGDPFVVIEAIKLVQGGLADRCNAVWLIDCDPATQRARLRSRGMDEADIERRLAVQGPDHAERLAPYAHLRIDTSGSRELVRERVEDALAELLTPRFAGLPWGPVDRP